MFDSFSILSLFRSFGVVSCLALLPVRALAANWFINQAVSTSGNGQSWTTAWKNPGNVAWSSVQPGDTIWIRGGTYSGGFTITKSGTSANWISIKRATVQDSAATSAAGWSAAFDAPVVINGGPAFWFNTASAGSYLSVDGRTPAGITTRYPNEANAFQGGVTFTAGGMHDITFANLDMGGPGGSTAFAHIGDNAVVNIRPNGGGVVSYVTIRDSLLHGGPNIVYNLSGNHHFTFIRNKFYDNGSSNSAIHANIVYTGGGNTEWTFVNNEFYNWQVEGINFYGQSNNPHYFYGNIFHSPMVSAARCFWMASETGAAQGPVYLYNNTFVGVNITYGESRASQYTSGSIARNNIYWNSSFYSGSVIANSDFNFSNGSTPGPNSISGGSDPFVNLAGKDFRLTSAVGAKFPKDKGVLVSTPSGLDYDLDPLGTRRGSDGAWDIGAYEYNGGASTSPPSPPINLRIN